MFRMLHLSDLIAREPLISQGLAPEFVTSLLDARTGAQLVQTASDIVRAIGFETFVYAVMLPNEANDPDVVVVTTMAREWVVRYDQMSYIEVDPRVQHSLRHTAPFIWDSTRSYGPKADAFLQDAARFGLRSGIMFPLRSTTGESTIFGVNSSRARLPDDDTLQLAIGRSYTFATYFHEWFFHNLINQRVMFEAPSAMPPVSRRELEVLALSARGHSSKRIGRELGISESTANYHIASVKKKFHVRTRSQAVAQAVQSGLIR